MPESIYITLVSIVITLFFNIIVTQALKGSTPGYSGARKLFTIINGSTFVLGCLLIWNII